MLLYSGCQHKGHLVIFSKEKKNWLISLWLNFLDMYTWFAQTLVY